MKKFLQRWLGIKELVAALDKTIKVLNLTSDNTIYFSQQYIDHLQKYHGLVLPADDTVAGAEVVDKGITGTLVDPPLKEPVVKGYDRP